MELTTGDDIKEDEYYIRKCMKDNYGLEFWLKAGGLFAIGPKARFIYLISGLYMAVWFILFPLLLMTLYQETGGRNVEIVCEAVHFTMFTILEVVFLASAIANNKVLAKTFVLMGKGFYDYQNTLDKECLEFIAQEKEEATKRKALIAKLFIGVVMCACVSITIIRPIMKFLLGEHLLGSPDDGLLRILPVTMWTPFSKDKWYVILIVWLSEYVIAYVTPGIVFGNTLYIVYTCQDVGTQLNILGYTLKSVVRRAKALNMPGEQALRLCFTHSINHHLKILTCVKSLENLLYFPGLGLLGGSTILMCMSGFIFVSDEFSFSSKIVFCLFLLSELFLIFLICWCGEHVQSTSTRVFDMVYSSEWPDNMSSMNYYLLIIQAYTMRPIKINFGGVMGASLETYSNIVSSAFSYFNILLAMN
nr:odorant receptor 25 [Graphosoma rubrolineatum]